MPETRQSKAVAGQVPVMETADPAAEAGMTNSDVRYARRLLASLGLAVAGMPVGTGRHPAVAWSDCRARALTGRPDSLPIMCPVPLPACADGALAALRCLSPSGALNGWSGAGLLTERARMLGLQRAGAVSPGGACHLLKARDGLMALNLAREDDWDLLPAWLEAGKAEDWRTVASHAAGRNRAELVDRGRLMGLAVCADEPPRREPVPWFSLAAEGLSRSVEPNRRPCVLELASLWAGPLCTRLLQALGAKVIKVESVQRPDGARRGTPSFFRRMNAGKHVCMLNWESRAGLEELRGLIAEADIVIEASRPRALWQRGLVPEELVRRHAGLTWVSITGYGRGEPECHRVAYGDDAGVAAGLTSVLRIASGEALICADAIADPLTGMHAALAAWAGYRSGGGRLWSVPMTGVVTHCIQHDLPGTDAALRCRQQAWTRIADQREEAA